MGKGRLSWWKSWPKNPILHFSLMAVLLSGMLDFTVVTNHSKLSGEPRDGVDVAVKVMASWGEEPVKVITYNIRHAQGLDGKVSIPRIAEELGLENADIIGLQEVDRYNIRSGFKDQVEQLGVRLGMDWAYAPALKLGFVEYGNAVLSKYPIEAADLYELPGKREKRAVMRVQIRYGDQLLDVWNTHLGVTEADRREQVAVLLQILNDPQEAGNAERPAILMGDFNMLDSHPLMKPLLEGWRKAKPEGLAATVLSGLEIDHILLRGNIYTKDAFAVPTYSSDHNPVVAELFIPRQQLMASKDGRDKFQ